MENHLCVLLREAKYDPKKMEQLISLFSPLIKKYAGKLFYMDAEDAEPEMKLAFLIAVHSMSYYNSEVECVSYIRNGLYRRFCALCREITKTAKKQQRMPNYVNMDLQKNMMMLKHYLITKCF